MTSSRGAAEHRCPVTTSRDSSSESKTSPSGRRVVVITGGSHGIGAGLVSGFRRARYAVVATSRSIEAADEDDYLTVRGDIADARTAAEVVEQALSRFGRIDCLVNDAGVFIGKPFTDYTLEDYVRGRLGEPGRILPSDPTRHRSDRLTGQQPP